MNKELSFRPLELNLVEKAKYAENLSLRTQVKDCRNAIETGNDELPLVATLPRRGEQDRTTKSDCEHP